MKKFFTMIVTALVAVSAVAQTWNFKVGGVEGFATSYATDKANLDAGVIAGTWELASSKEGRYQANYKTSNEQLAANDAVLEITKGLYVTGASGKFRVDVANNQFGFNGKDLSMRIKGLKAGQKLSFVSRSASNSALDRYFEATTNLEVVEGFDVPAEGNPEKTNTATVKEEGDVVITAKVGGLNVMSITVYNTDGTEMTKEQVITQGESYVAPREMTGNIINATTTWTAPQDKENQTELSAGVTEYQGLYLRGATGSHSVKAYTESASGTLAGEFVDVAVVFGFSGNSNLAPAPEASADVEIKNATDMSIALNVGVAGKLYLLMRPASLTDGRYVWIYKTGEKLATDWKTKDVEGTPKSDYDVVELENDAAGATYFIGGSLPLRIAAVKFVKEGTPTGISSVTATEQGNDKWYNLAGQVVTQPTKGIYIKNGCKYIIK